MKPSIAIQTMLYAILLNQGSIIYAQTVYGVNGLIKVPSAYTTENGKATLSTGYFQDYLYGWEPDLLRHQWTVGFNIGFLSRFEMTARLAGIPSVLVQDEPTYRYDYLVDRSLSAKFVLLQEKNKSPQIAIGVQDFAGTRYFNSTYIVVSKQFPLPGYANLSMETTLGWGTKINNEIFGDALNHRLIGPFGGLILNFLKWGFLMVEYDGRDINLGVKIRPWKWLEFQSFATDVRYLGGGMNLKFGL